MKHGVPVSQTFHYSIFGESSAMLTSRGANPTRAGRVERPWGERGGTILSSPDEGALSWQGGRTRHLSGFSPTGYYVLRGLDAVLLFHSKLCDDERTKRFLWVLQDKLRQLEIEQHCKLQLTATFCFPSLNNPSDEFIIQVQLEGRAPGKKHHSRVPRGQWRQWGKVRGVQALQFVLAGGRGRQHRAEGGVVKLGPFGRQWCLMARFVQGFAHLLLELGLPELHR